MSIVTENAKKWFSPFTAWKQRPNVDVRGELDYLFQCLYRTFTGQLNRPWISAVEVDGLKNHLGFFDYIIPGAYFIETFCRGYWLHKIPSIQNVEKAKKILTALTSFIWVPLNVLRGTFGVVCTTAAIIVGILLVLPISYLVNKVRSSGRRSPESEPEIQNEAETAYEAMIQNEDQYENPYGMPRPARAGKFWGKQEKGGDSSYEVLREPPSYQKPDPRSAPKGDTPALYSAPKPLMYGEASSDPVTAAVSPGF